MQLTATHDASRHCATHPRSRAAGVASIVLTKPRVPAYQHGQTSGATGFGGQESPLQHQQQPPQRAPHSPRPVQEEDEWRPPLPSGPVSNRAAKQLSWRVSNADSIQHVCWHLHRHAEHLDPTIIAKAVTRLVNLSSQQQRQTQHATAQSELNDAGDAAAAAHEQQQQRQQRRQAVALQLTLHQLLERWVPGLLPGFSPRELSTLLWGLARLHPRVAITQRQLTPLADTLVAAGAAANAHDVGLALWALARLAALPPPPRLAVLLDAQLPHLPAYPPRSLALVARALATSPPPLRRHVVDALLMAAAPQLAAFKATDLSMMLWSLSRLCWPPAPWLARFLAAALRRLPDFTSEELAALMVALARLGCVPPPPWLRRLYGQLYWTADQLGGRQLAGLLWALARLGLQPPTEVMERLLTFVALRAEEKRGAAAGAAAAGAQVTGGAAAAAAPGPAAAAAAGQELSMVLWSLARLGYDPEPEWMEGCQPLLLQLAPYMSGRSLSTVLWAVGRLGLQLPHSCAAALVARLDAVLQLQLAQLEGQALRAGALEGQRRAQQAPSLGAQDAAAVLPLQAKPGTPQQQQQQLQAPQQQQQPLSGQGVAMTLWGLARLRLLLPPATLDRAMALALQLLPSMQPGELCALLAASARLRAPPPPGFAAAVAARVAQLTPALSAASLAALAASLVALRVPLQPGQLAVLSQRVRVLEAARCGGSVSLAEDLQLLAELSMPEAA